MAREQRIIYLLGLVGLGIIVYMFRNGRLGQSLIGLVLGFTAGFLLDASTREKSLLDNLSLGLFFSGVVAYIDFMKSLTTLVRNHLGEGFVIVIVVLSVITLLGASFDEIRVGKTVRVPVIPTVLLLLSLGLLLSAVTTNSSVSYTRTFYPAALSNYNDDRAKRVNVTDGSSYTKHIYPGLPVINGSKSVSFSQSVSGLYLQYITVVIYSPKNTSRVRHPGNFTLTAVFSPAPPNITHVRLIFISGTGALLRTPIDILPDSDRTYNQSSGTLTLVYPLSSIDVYFSNIALVVKMEIDFQLYQTDTITSSLKMSIVGERVLNKTLVYGALVFEGLAALMAIPEGSRPRLRKTRTRR